MATRIVVANTKGGAGKTTLSLATGGELALMGNRVLMVALDAHNPGLMTYFLNDEEYVDDETLDIDPRRSSCVLFTAPEESFTQAIWSFDLDVGRRSTLGIPAASLTEAAQQHGWRAGGHLHVIPDAFRLGEVARDIPELARKRRMDPTHLLRHALRDADSAYDYIIFDTPPDRSDLDLVAGNALAAADMVILPLKIDRLTLAACRVDLQRIRALSRERMANGEKPLHILGVSVSQYIAGNLRHENMLTRLRGSNFRKHLFDAVLPFDSSVGDATFANDLPQLYNPASPFAKKVPLLVREVVARVQQITH